MDVGTISLFEGGGNKIHEKLLWYADSLRERGHSSFVIFLLSFMYIPVIQANINIAVYSDAVDYFCFFLLLFLRVVLVTS